MDRKLWIALIAVPVASACGAQTPKSDEPAWPEGIFGNVELSEESGDLSGFEVRFFDDDGKRMAEFVYCEGWCNRAYRAEVTRQGDAFRFSHAKELHVYGDAGAALSEGKVVEYSVVRAGGGLSYKWAFDGAPIPLPADLSSLAPLKEPFGLAVAKGQQ
jgi:hypothetical protein